MSASNDAGSAPQAGNAPQAASNALLAVTSEVLFSTNRTLQKVIIYLVIFASVVSIVAVYLFIAGREVETEGYAVTADGRVYPLEKIRGEIFTPARVTSWAGDSIKGAYSLTFKTKETGEWQNNLSNIFTDPAKKDFIAALQRDGILKDVEEKSAVVYAEFSTSTRPLYMGAGETETGLKVHRIEVDLVITIDARGMTKDRNRTIRMPMALGVGEVGLGKAKDGLLIGNFKRVTHK